MQAIHHLLTLQQQGAEILVAAQLEMQPMLTGARLLQAITESRADLQAEFPQAKWVFIEPVAPDDGAFKNIRTPSSRGRRVRRRRSRSAHA